MQGDLRNKEDLEKLFSQTKYVNLTHGVVRNLSKLTLFDGVIHFAGLKAVGESVIYPLRYFDNNLIGSINLYQTMAKYNCKKECLVFSSSSTVYGQPEKIPCVEDFELIPMNPYGRTKLFLEEIARDIQSSYPGWRMIFLRYFNPVGAHESGKIGEDPKGIPNNLMPYIQQVAVGRLPELNVYGHDYPTPDGTAIQDYIHVMDLADGHIAALRKLFTTKNIGCSAYNLATGRGTSVLEMVAAFEKASGKGSVVGLTSLSLSHAYMEPSSGYIILKLVVSCRKSPSNCVQEEQVMPLQFMLLQRKLRMNLVGRQNMVLKKCAGTNGIGRARIRWGSNPGLEWTCL
ncbi:hypothetical protein HYC85_014619 [Camellia sinensis]|uniref:NAD-dependent epimerase/dehydratase domain-containing protein n=1 Tax=Camellia sinensis TaxID=4442 RepID=A0A7J7H6P3_CAMSI|nr:hypothetical protein HYC85_014619 [Camellia sinensis]